jgi:nucleoside-diphosphate-sugar epimerase
MKHNILITGGAGYVGAVLSGKLAQLGHQVKVYDLFLYGKEVFDQTPKKNLELIQADIRDTDRLAQNLKGVDTVFHLACISNDPSFELNPQLGKSINLDCFRPMVETCKKMGVKRFIYASSSSVYGVKEEPNVHEEVTLEPLTDYSKFKADCEKILAEYTSDNFETVTIRPATVCGYSPRQRLDVIVNILTNHAYHNKKIKILGGEQLRPNIHIDDMVDLYIQLLNEDKKRINGKIFNAGYENYKVKEIAGMVKNVFGLDVQIVTEPTDDNRSYHVCSKKIARELGFVPKRTIEDAVKDLKRALDQGLLPDSMNNKKYFNIKTMKDLALI